MKCSYCYREETYLFAVIRDWETKKETKVYDCKLCHHRTAEVIKI